MIGLPRAQLENWCIACKCITSSEITERLSAPAQRFHSESERCKWEGHIKRIHACSKFYHNSFTIVALGHSAPTLGHHESRTANDRQRDQRLNVFPQARSEWFDSTKKLISQFARRLIELNASLRRQRY
ncbi:hypothetical protein EVAR_50428_1 [Eumeta japonica]|uniref:Uncharacterized protein n=1 Tax=Eumeta variegata TaxID=151549 RepID=A0A4C1WVP3_EUMVA|nr:hypothetical protein EVAR_50428_1 [Eumeta japonica]